jgi:hypothetical protein
METTSVHFKSSRIVVQTLCFISEHFLPKRLENHVFHRNLKAFFSVFLGTNYENTLFVDDTPYESLFNPPFNAIFLETFYRPQVNNNSLFETVLPCLEALHSIGMQVKSIECNPFGRIIHVLPFDLWYEKLATPCSSKCNDIFCNMMKSKPSNKKR